jgi:hypothetical protein
MDCGADQYACQLLAWMSGNEFAATVLSRLVAHIGDHAAGVVGWLALMWRDHGDKLIALAGVAFGAWRWWRYREQILHKRLDEYLRESDGRLADGQAYVLEAIQRPGPGRPFKLPLFASLQLRSVLREHRWNTLAVAANVAGSADWQLRSAMDKIRDQLETMEQTASSLHRQLATAYILRGAIASSTPLRLWTDDASRNAFALTSFRAALQIPGHESDVVAKELEAHQLRKLGQWQAALIAYQEFEKFAATITDYRTQRLSVVRAKRYQAEILQAQTCTKLPDGTYEFAGTLGAYNLLASPNQPSALNMRSPLGPFQGWDALEQGDIHYLTAFVSRNLGFPLVIRTQLDDAETAYERVLDELPKRRWFLSGGKRRLRTKAIGGLARLKEARKRDQYDAGWLMPGLK